MKRNILTEEERLQAIHDLASARLRNLHGQEGPMVVHDLKEIVRLSAAAEPEAKAEEVIKVQREEFERDPLSWFRRASTTRRVVVMEGEELSLVIGGSMEGLR